MSATFDLSEEEIQKRLVELAEDNRSLRGMCGSVIMHPFYENDFFKKQEFTIGVFSSFFFYFGTAFVFFFFASLSFFPQIPAISQNFSN